MQGHCDLTDDWSALVSLTAGAHFGLLVWGRSFIKPDFLKTVYHSTIYHSNLSDQSALEIGLGLGLDLELQDFSIFRENKENEHIFFREYHGW